MARGKAPAIRCAVVIAAGGSGTRMGSAKRKQYVDLLGKPILLWSVDFFARSPHVEQIVIVAPDKDIAATTELVRADPGDKHLRVIAGGERRQDSVLKGVEAVSSELEFAAVHDAARPFPPPNLEDGLRAAKVHGAAIFAIPVTDSLKKAGGGLIASRLDRDDLWAAQTPQIARRENLIEALRFCNSRGITVGDEAEALQLQRFDVAIVNGSRTNIKITTQEDLQIAEGIARMLQPTNEVGASGR